MDNQFVAWGRDRSTPQLIATTADSVLVQFATAGGVLVAVTTGGPHYLIFVISFEGGKDPSDGVGKLVLQAVTKSDVQIHVNQSRLRIEYKSLRGEPRQAEYPTRLEFGAR